MHHPEVPPTDAAGTRLGSLTVLEPRAAASADAPHGSLR